MLFFSRQRARMPLSCARACSAYACTKSSQRMPCTPTPLLLRVLRPGCERGASVSHLTPPAAQQPSNPAAVQRLCGCKFCAPASTAWTQALEGDLLLDDDRRTQPEVQWRVHRLTFSLAAAAPLPLASPWLSPLSSFKLLEVRAPRAAPSLRGCTRRRSPMLWALSRGASFALGALGELLCAACALPPARAGRSAGTPQHGLNAAALAAAHQLSNGGPFGRGHGSGRRTLRHRRRPGAAGGLARAAAAATTTAARRQQPALRRPPLLCQQRQRQRGDRSGSGGAAEVRASHRRAAAAAARGRLRHRISPSSPAAAAGRGAGPLAGRRRRCGRPARHTPCCSARSPE